MTTLHTVNKSPFATGSLESCLSHVKDGDAVLMIEDGIYGAISGSKIADNVAGNSNIKLYALAPDVEARGVEASRLIKDVALIDYAGFVDLAARHDRTNAWL